MREYWSNQEAIAAGLLNLYPEGLQEEVDRMNDWLFDNVHSVITRARFTESLGDFIDAYQTFFAALDVLDQRLEDQRFLFGDYVTDSDVRLYTTLVRFDIADSRVIGPCRHRLVDYKNLWPYARDLYQIPAFRHNTDFYELADSREKKGFYGCSVYYDLVVPATDFDMLWKTATGRETLSKDPANKVFPVRQEAS